MAKEFRLGRHISSNNGLAMMPWYSHTLGYDIFQIFLGMPQQVLSKARQRDELVALSAALKKYGQKMVIHGSYTINLCHPVKSKRFAASVKSLVQDLIASDIIGPNCFGVIIHMGKNIPENKITDTEALENYVNGIKRVLAQTPESTIIILETGASQGHEVASEIDSLAEIYGKLSKAEQLRVHFCIDTCHIWATGYDISNAIGVKNFFAEFDDKIGIDKIICIHFNDSKTILESNVDRHADLGYGYIKSDGLKAVAQFAKRNKIPLIMETPLDAVNVETNRDITFEEERERVDSWLNSK